MKIGDICESLKDEVASLEQRFLKRHLRAKKFKRPGTYKLDVKAYAVLSHAALEQAFEDLAEQVADSALRQYKNYRTVSAPLLSMLSFVGSPLPVKTEEKTLTLHPYEDHLESLNGSARIFKDSTIQRNQGMSCKYLARLLIPIGVASQPDVDELDAINQLKDYRGDFAHRFQARLVIEPKVAAQLVGFCVQYFDRVAEEAAALIHEGR
jgi:hypothetical protein